MPDVGIWLPVGQAFPSGLLIASSIAAAMTATAFLGMMLFDWTISPEWVEAEPPAERHDESGG